MTLLLRSEGFSPPADLWAIFWSKWVNCRDYITLYFLSYEIRLASHTANANWPCGLPKQKSKTCGYTLIFLLPRLGHLFVFLRDLMHSMCNHYHRRFSKATLSRWHIRQYVCFVSSRLWTLWDSSELLESMFESNHSLLIPLSIAIHLKHCFWGTKQFAEWVVSHLS